MKFDSPCSIIVDRCLKDNSTMDKTEAQIVSYGILCLNTQNRGTGAAILAC